MRHPSLLKIVLTAAACFSLVEDVRAADAAALRRAEAEVRLAVRDVVAAYATTDLDKYFSYYADDMTVCCFQGGWWSKQAYYKARSDNIATGGGVSRSAIEDLRVQMAPSGEAAITTFQLRATRKMPPQGQSPEILYNMTETWFKRDGRWLISGLTFSTATAGSRGPLTTSRAR